MDASHVGPIATNALRGLMALRVIAQAKAVPTQRGLADEDGHSRRIMENGSRAMTRLHVVY